MSKKAILIQIPFIDATKRQLTFKAILANKLSLDTTISLAHGTFSSLPVLLPFFVYPNVITHLMMWKSLGINKNSVSNNNILIMGCEGALHCEAVDRGI